MRIYIGNNQREKAITYGGENYANFKIAKDSLNILLYTEALRANANIHWTNGEIIEAEKFYLDGLEILKEFVGKELRVEGRSISYYVLYLNQLTNFYNKNGEFLNAETYAVDALEIIKKVKGIADIRYIESYVFSAQTYIGQEKYSKAEPLLYKALEIQKKTLGKEHHFYAEILNELGLIFLRQDDYKKSELLFLEILELETMGVENSVYPNFLANLARLYMSSGLWIKAFPLLIDLLENAKKQDGDKSVEYAEALENLSYYYSIGLNDLDTALKLALTSLEIRENNNVAKDESYVFALTNLGKLMTGLGQYEKAEKYLLEANEISNNIDYNYDLHLFCLGDLYLRQKRFSKAESIILDLLETSKTLYGVGHTNYTSFHKKLAEIYYIQEKYEQAAHFLNLSLDSFQNEINSVSGYLGGFDVTDFKFSAEGSFSDYLAFLEFHPNKFDNINIGCFETLISLKRISLKNQKRVKKIIERSNDSIMHIKYNNFIDNKKFLASQIGLLEDNKNDRIDSIEAETDKLESELLLTFSDLPEIEDKSFNNWKEIRNKLNHDEVVIELVSYHSNERFYSESISTFYGAFILKKEFKVPKYIKLFEEEQINKLIGVNETENDFIDSLYMNQSLSNLFLKPIFDDLKDINTIYLSPAGFGHQIDFSALPLSNNQTLGEKYNTHMFGSSTELINYQASILTKSPKPEVLLYGDIDYDKKADINKTIEKDKIVLPDEFNVLATRSGITQWGYLPGTAKEVKKIKELASKSRFKTIIFDGQRASKESILKLDGKNTPFVLHLATHGFFFPSSKKELPDDINRLIIQDSSFGSKKNIYNSSEDPMLRSGLLFSGANKYWGKEQEKSISDNGILTAKEIANLDLRSCELVVMSACDTGLGAIEGSEGVYGLQRAFEMAGVKNIIMSLWKVPDQQTAELFEEFYKQAFKGKSVHEALRIAQVEMKKKYSPFYWAGFILLE